MKHIWRLPIIRRDYALGVFERLNIYSMLLWVAVFAVTLLRARNDPAHSVAEPAHPADSAPEG
jgi:hypothetical protein